MRDYADIISQIRIAAIGVKKQSNRLTLMQDAADAIEELQARNDKQTIMIRKQSERIKELLAAVPQWISVEEQPIPYDWVWSVYRQTVCGKVMQHHKTVRMHGDNIVDQEGNIYNGFITHWMPRFPLPAPPKEV